MSVSFMPLDDMKRCHTSPDIRSILLNWTFYCPHLTTLSTYHFLMLIPSVLISQKDKKVLSQICVINGFYTRQIKRIRKLKNKRIKKIGTFSSERHNSLCQHVHYLCIYIILYREAFNLSSPRMADWMGRVTFCLIVSSPLQWAWKKAFALSQHQL